MASQENLRAQRARTSLAETLDDIEARFHPGYVGRVAVWSLTQSWKRHPVKWGVAAGVTVAILGGLAVWALLANDDDVD
jgi:hypothetical protein